jgi:hypothetical protein
MESRCKGKSDGVLRIARLPALDQPILIKKR